MTLQPGTRVAGRYEVLRSEGAAPAYHAFRALDHEVEVEILLWLVRHEILPDEGLRQAFCANALRARALSHASLRRVFDAGLYDGGCYVTMQPLDGESLAGRSGPLPEAELARLGAALAEALAVAHGAHLSHGWLRPADVTIVTGLPKIGGVGLWSTVDPLGAQRAFRSEAQFLAPEVVVGERPSASSDAYSLAMILKRLALGDPGPRDGEQLAAAFPRLARALGRALDEDPKRRPTCAELAVALSAATAPVEEEEAPTRHYLSLEDAPPADPDFPTDEVATPPIVLAVAPKNGRSSPHRIATPVEDLVASAPALDPLPASAPVAAPAPVPVRAPAPAPAPVSASGPWPAPTPRPARPQPNRLGLQIAIAAVCLAVVGGLIWLVVLLSSDPSIPARPARAVAPRSTPPPAPAPPKPAPIVADSLSPCPQGTVLVAGSTSFCIDAHEFPGAGFTPVASVTVEQARAGCESRGKRLCTAAEWERACRGPGGASYPYGESHVAGKCNERSGGKAQLVPAGSFPECASAIGAFDMSGNVAEWVAEGTTRGGSAADGDDGRCSRETKRAPGAVAPDVGYRCCGSPGAF